MAFIMVISSFSFGSTVNINGQTKTLETLVVSDRTFVTSDSMKSYGLNTIVTEEQIKVFNSNVEFVFFNLSNRVKVNGIEMTMDSKTFKRNGKVYIPMRFIFEAMNYEVGYNSNTKQITMKTRTEVKFPLTIEDSGKSYTFQKPVESIVSLAPSITEILFAIGAESKILGRTIYCKYPLATEKIRTVGSLYEPDLEGILDLAPDAVIAATHMNEDVMKKLGQAGISTITQKSPEKTAEIYTLIEQLGLITDRNYTARALVSTLKAKEQRINNIVKVIPQNELKTVYYVVATGNKEYSAGKLTFIHEVLSGAGGINVAADVDKWAYSLEKLLDHNPEFILGEKYQFDTMIESGNYKSLSALKNGKFIFVDTNLFSIPGPRVIDGGMKLVIETLYPKYKYMLNY
jgi:iron complex transport system substrate-binding protein